MIKFCAQRVVFGDNLCKYCEGCKTSDNKEEEIDQITDILKQAIKNNDHIKIEIKHND